jgi:hypothetical protein
MLPNVKKPFMSYHRNPAFVGTLEIDTIIEAGTKGTGSSVRNENDALGDILRERWFVFSSGFSLYCAFVRRKYNLIKNRHNSALLSYFTHTLGIRI